MKYKLYQSKRFRISLLSGPQKNSKASHPIRPIKTREPRGPTRPPRPSCQSPEAHPLPRNEFESICGIAVGRTGLERGQIWGGQDGGVSSLFASITIAMVSFGFSRGLSVRCPALRVFAPGNPSGVAGPPAAISPGYCCPGSVRDWSLLWVLV